VYVALPEQTPLGSGIDWTLSRGMERYHGGFFAKYFGFLMGHSIFMANYVA
jgi:hypothetical protein